MSSFLSAMKVLQSKSSCVQFANRNSAIDIAHLTACNYDFAKKNKISSLSLQLGIWISKSTVSNLQFEQEFCRT